MTVFASSFTQKVVRVGARYPLAFLVTTDDGANYTDYLSQISGSGHAQLDALPALGSGGHIIIRCDSIHVRGFVEAIYNSEGNTNTATMAVKYWNGSAWTAVSSLVDGTAGSKSMDQDGAAEWAYPGTGWVKNTVDGVEGYHLQVSWNAALSATVSIDTLRLLGRVELAARRKTRTGLYLLNHPTSSSLPTYTGKLIYTGNDDVLPGDDARDQGGLPLPAGAWEDVNLGNLVKCEFYADMAYDAGISDYALVTVRESGGPD